MNKHRKIIRCMAYKEKDLYIAVCLDLSLASQGNSLNEAMAKLDNQIKDYIDEALAEPQYTQQLLNRPSPISLWIKYYWLKFLIAKNGNKQGISFFENECFA